MFWKNTLRVSNACKAVLDYMLIESRIEIAYNRGVCLGVVTAMVGEVHRPGLSGDWLAMADSSNFGVVTGHGGVHHHVHDGALSVAVRYHRHFLTEAKTCWS